MPLSRVLRDFGAATVVSPPPAEPGATAPAMAPHVSDEDALAARLSAAHEEGREAGRSAARAEHEQEQAKAHAHAEEHLAAERQRWTETEGAALAARLTSAAEEIEARIAAQVARVLTPFMTAELRETMLRELSETISRLIAGGRHARLQISGPDDLLDSLRERLGACPAEVEWTPSAQIDVSLVVNDSVIETDIASWIERFAEAAR